MSSKAQPVRAVFRARSRLAGTAVSRSRALPVRAEFGQRVFVGAAGQKIKAGNT